MDFLVLYQPCIVERNLRDHDVFFIVSITELKIFTSKFLMNIDLWFSFHENSVLF